MNEVGIKAKSANLSTLGLTRVKKANWNLTPGALVEQAILRNEGKLCDNGALAADTGKFTGRSPKDRFIVCDSKTENTVWWGDINIKFDADKFDSIHQKMIKYLEDKEVFVKDAYACAEPDYRLNLRVVTETAFQNLFAHNLFLRPEQGELNNFEPEWSVIAAPGFEANPEVDGTRQPNFAIINFTKKMILIGGTAYTGEIKKGIFSVLNYILPHEKNVLSMHCSANIGNEGDTAIFFGLSGTGKTTLSADPTRKLIGDDEHGWTIDSVFNFEGGCYAKVIDLTEKNEPDIYRAIKFGALVENIRFHPNTRYPDYENTTVTENTRAAYPIHHIDNAILPSKGPKPKNIFLLTCDAFGVLPPISRLNEGQAMYHFLSGYTAKVAGTEAGITEPVSAFSACFGAPFLPLHPTAYAKMLGEKIVKDKVNIWLINTGWTGGAYGIGNRISLKYTRATINAALEGKLNAVEFEKDPVFGLQIPKSCPDVPSEILFPRNTWSDKAAYDAKAKELAAKFVKNFEKFADFASDDIKSAAPKA
jgi:phosphoenolpyruvate carboxykinase (ATP)